MSGRNRRQRRERRCIRLLGRRGLISRPKKHEEEDQEKQDRHNQLEEVVLSYVVCVVHFSLCLGFLLAGEFLCLPDQIIFIR